MHQHLGSFYGSYQLMKKSLYWGWASTEPYTMVMWGACTAAIFTGYLPGLQKSIFRSGQSSIFESVVA
jgi:hypothetical protein